MDEVNKAIGFFIIVVIVVTFGVIVIQQTASVAVLVESNFTERTEGILSNFNVANTLAFIPFSGQVATVKNQTWLEFDGVNDSINHTISFNSQGYTINIWINPINDTNRKRFFTQSNIFSGYFGDTGNDGTDFVWFIGNGTALSGGKTKTNLMTYDEWQQISIVYDGSTTGTLYYNGVSVDTQALVSSGVSRSSAAVCVGSSNSGLNCANNLFNGSIDNVLFSNVSFHVNQLKRLYNESFRGSGFGKSIPVLSYHDINLTAHDNTFKLNITQFTEQMDYLDSNGYETINYDEYFSWRQGTFTLPNKPVIITFDDGNIGEFNLAYPVMEARGFKGVMNVVTGLTSSAGFVSWENITTLYNDGWQIGSHSVNASVFVGMTPTLATALMQQSKDEIEGNLSNTVTLWQYPGNSNNATYDNICAGIYIMCNGEDGGVLSSANRYIYPVSNLTHSNDANPGVLGLVRLSVVNITTFTQFKQSLEYRDSNLIDERLNENNGTTAHDVSGNSNDGTITGATWQDDGINNTLTPSVDYSVSEDQFTIDNSEFAWSFITFGYTSRAIVDSATGAITRLINIMIAILFLVVIAAYVVKTMRE